MTQIPNYPAISDVAVGDDFLGRKIRLNREETLPHILHKLYETGAVENFARAAGIHKGDYIGLHNADEFLYKAIEAASYVLMYEYDEQLDVQLDEIIAWIAAAQEPDGYLRTPHTIYWVHGGKPERSPRWARLNKDSELYSLGHMYEAAAAHYMATGKTTLLNVAVKSVDLVDSLFGIGKPIRGVDRIPEIELALIKLYEATEERKYLNLARYFIEERGDASGHELMGEFALDHMPLREQPEAVGHSTFAAYFYSGAAELVVHDEDDGYWPALQRLWRDSIFRKMYINGGFGSRHDNEGFGEGYDLPNLTAYNEICAAVGYSLLNARLFRLDRHGKYFDVLERTLYNNLLSGVSSDGKQFFYVCPTESDGKFKFNLGWIAQDYDGPYKEREATRKPWIPCACCPPTLARLLPQIPALAYAVADRDVYVNLYLTSRAQLAIGDDRVAITQTTNYPFDETIRATVGTEQPAAFALRLRIPGWLQQAPIHGDLYRFADDLAAQPLITVNGIAVDSRLENGYAVIEREWRAGDTILLTLPLHIRRVESHPSIGHNAGKVALQRGPVLYCAEGRDNGGGALDIAVPDEAVFERRFDPELLGGTDTIVGDAFKVDENGNRSPHRLTAIPYYAWSNRGVNEMAVWFRRWQ